MVKMRHKTKNERKKMEKIVKREQVKLDASVACIVPCHVQHVQQIEHSATEDLYAFGIFYASHAYELFTYDRIPYIHVPCAEYIHPCAHPSAQPRQCLFFPFCFFN